MTRLLAVAALILGVCSADTLTLRSGRVVNGSYLGGDSRQIRIAVGDRIESFSIADVVRLEFGSLSTSDNTPLPTRPPAMPQSTPRDTERAVPSRPLTN